MPKFSISAHELTDTNVDFVALVKRGANRIPFRLTKGDNEMLDLYSIGRRMFKSDEPAPVVIGAILTKGADVEGAVAVLKSVGVDVSTFVKCAKNGVVTFARKNEDAPEGVMFLKMAGGVTLAVANLQKSFQGYDFQSPDFGEVHAKGSHVASMSNAADSLHNTLGNCLDNATDPKDCADKMGKACDDYKDHITKLTSALPVHAFKADQALMKAEVAKLLKAGKSPHAGVAMALAHAAHATANAIGGMLAGGGTDDDQMTGDTSGKAAAQAKPAKKADLGTGDIDQTADDPLMPPKGKGTATAVDAKKIDAGKNGTGAGFELGEGTGDTPSATSDDAANTEVNAAPGGTVSGDSSGLPGKAKAPTKKSAVAVAQLAIAKAELAVLLPKDDEIEDDDSTNGAQSDLPKKVKAPTVTGGVNKAALITDVTTEEVTGESQAGEGAAAAMSDIDTSQATADDAANAGGDVTGKVKGKTLSLDGVPAKLISPTTKNDGDAEIGKKGKGNQLDDSMSGSGAQEADVQTLKSDAVMKAIQALSKSVQESLAAVNESVKKTNTRVEAVAVMAQKNDAALNGTVFNDAGDDADFVRKNERSNAPPLMDTAYNRRSAA